jgi:hypothetical protein
MGVMTDRGTNLVSKGRGKFINRPTKTGRRSYDKFFVYVPTEVARDSAFPFKDGEVVEVEIDAKGKRLLVKRG